jgi:hypothetical protein
MDSLPLPPLARGIAHAGASIDLAIFLHMGLLKVNL